MPLSARRSLVVKEKETHEAHIKEKRDIAL